jgi:N-acyl-D-amino-acid deacylase
MEQGRRQGIDVTFDLYCYLAGSSILGMVALPPWVQEGGVAATVKRLADPKVREELRGWFAAPKTPLETIRIGYVANPSQRHLEGMTVAQAAEMTNKRPGDFICDVLVDSDMAVGCVVPHMQRGAEDIRQLMRHPGMMAGSDGIYTGSHPHPRGCGCFARYLSHYVRTEPTWQLEEAIQKLSNHAARRFGLKDRGLIREGYAADIIVFDPETIADRSTFDEGRNLATGMDSVLVNGQAVLVGGKRTGALPGRGLRRS